MTGVYQIYPKKRTGFFAGRSATSVLIWVNIIFFIVSLFFLAIIPNFFDYISLKPDFFMKGKYLWTIMTHMFMHAPGAIPFLSFHLLINMFVLFSLGGMMERIIGKKRFLWFYLSSGLFAGLLFVFLSYFFGNTELGARIFGSSLMSAVGASGAIFAIAGLFMMLTPRLKFMIIFLPFFSLPAYLMIPIVLFGTWLVSSSTGFPIGNTAHLGGLIAGLIYGIYLRKKYPRKIQMLARYFK